VRDRVNPAQTASALHVTAAGLRLTACALRPAPHHVSKPGDDLNLVNSMVLTSCEDYGTVVAMFERFTKRARRAVVLAQEEARGLRHNYIGTEHVLLGLLGEPESVASRALARFGVSLADARGKVKAIVGTGEKELKGGHIPFTPRAKKVLELALREALQLGHNYIGTEHILLGVVREGDGVAAQILKEYAGDLKAVRAAVLNLLPAVQASQGRRWLRRRPTTSAEEPGEPEEIRTTPAADTSLDEAARLARPNPVGSHHLLLAALGDPDTAAARALAALGVDLDRAREALRNADVTGTSDEPPEEAGRRQMLIRVTDSSLTVEATDEVIVGLARKTLEALAEQGELGEQGEQPDTIRGDLPVSASLGNVWQAIHDSLEDMGQRAAPAEESPGNRRLPFQPIEPTEPEAEAG
jgi:ATP-dependent Clp protease ATP-binding subunit ClpA